jgi:hypothetical protein
MEKGEGSARPVLLPAACRPPPAATPPRRTAHRDLSCALAPYKSNSVLCMRAFRSSCVRMCVCAYIFLADALCVGGGGGAAPIFACVCAEAMAALRAPAHLSLSRFRSASLLECSLNPNLSTRLLRTISRRRVPVAHLKRAHAVAQLLPSNTGLLLPPPLLPLPLLVLLFLTRARAKRPSAPRARPAGAVPRGPQAPRDGTDEKTPAPSRPSKGATRPGRARPGAAAREWMPQRG